MRFRLPNLIKKAEPSSSDVHVPVPLGGGKRDEEAIPPTTDNLEAGIIKAALTAEGRDHIADDNFALPSSRGYPIHDISHARNALARASGKPEEKEVRTAVYRKYPSLKPDVQKEAAKPRRVATVAIQHGDHTLMGKRRDNGKWTTPGGHLNDDEDFHQGALREVEEETGIKLGSDDVEPLTEVHETTDREGKPLHIQPFQAKLAERPTTTMKEDPDGEVHRWHWINTADGMPEDIAQNLHVPAQYNILLQSLGLADGVMKDANGETDDLYAAQQVVSGLDYELMTNQSGLADEDMANEVSANLDEDPDHYRKKWLEHNWSDEPMQKNAGDVGFGLDLGSGQAREPQYLGLDLYPFDHGTMIHDVSLGLPFPDESTDNVRLVNALHHMDGVDPKALMAEIQRVLTPGGEFYYEGPEELKDLPDYLEETHKEVGVTKDLDEDRAQWVKQSFKRVAQPDPATAQDSEPRAGLDTDFDGADIALAADAIGYYWSDATTSGRQNRLHGYPSQGAPISKEAKIRKSVPILKANKDKQIVYGVVLSPDEADLQDDIITADDIEKTAHDYLIKSRVVGKSHSSAMSAVPIESYIAPQDFQMSGGQYGPQVVKKGAWVLGVKIIDPKEWRKVVDGEYQGFSVGGFGLRDKIAS